MPIDLFTDSLDAVDNDQLFAAVKEFAETQAIEGWRHDYTVQWEESALKDIAAFANTFGGLLIVGVKKGKKDAACELVGVESDSEYKTRIASSIAANISPVPSYNVFECHKPGVPTKKFCVVRIRERKHLHLITKKNFDPVYVRNEDEARPADAAQLRRLIDRERDMPALAERTNARANQLLDALKVNLGYQDKDSDKWFFSPRQPSPTFLKLAIIPAEAMVIELDKSYEDRVDNLIAGLYPRVRDAVRRDIANQAEDRGADFYEYVWYHKNLDYEGRWRVTGTADIGHATQMLMMQDVRVVWSAVDLARYVVLFTRLAMKWWESIGYFGDGRLHAELSVPALVLRDSSGNYTQAFDPTSSREVPARTSIVSHAIFAPAAPRTRASAEIAVNYFSGNADRLRITTSVLNQLLRSLGYGVLWTALQNSIQALVEN